ncbi:MAG: aldo/keto reductase [Cyanobacteria bacterium P01_D01_bin.73]
MLYRRFGKTELSMPVFSCGGMRYQQAWTDLKPDTIKTDGQQNLETVIRRSLELGINHIETARGYGSSEMQLGWVLPKLPREKMIIQTKVGPRKKVEEFEKSFHQSLQYLQLDYVDLFGIHGINTPQDLENTLRPGGCLDKALEWKKQGKLRRIGFSTHGPTHVILDAIKSGRFDYVNLHWYYINQFNWPAIQAATKLDMGVFIISPTNKGGKLNEPPQKLVDLCRPLSPIVFNDLFCLSHPQVHTLSLGAAQPSDFDEHLKTLEFVERAAEVLPPILQRLERAMVDAFDGALGAGQGEVWKRSWHRGLPEPHHIPGEISVRTMVWLWNLAKAFDLTEYAKMRYNLLGNGGDWFPGQRGDRLSEFDLSDSLKSSPHMDKIPRVLEEAHALFAEARVKRESQS